MVTYDDILDLLIHGFALIPGNTRHVDVHGDAHFVSRGDVDRKVLLAAEPVADGYVTCDLEFQNNVIRHGGPPIQIAARSWPIHVSKGMTYVIHGDAEEQIGQQRSTSQDHSLSTI
jgi:hypothetical protein